MSYTEEHLVAPSYGLMPSGPVSSFSPPSMDHLADYHSMYVNPAPSSVNYSLANQSGRSAHQSHFSAHYYNLAEPHFAHYHPYVDFGVTLSPQASTSNCCNRLFAEESTGTYFSSTSANYKPYLMPSASCSKEPHSPPSADIEDSNAYSPEENSNSNPGKSIQILSNRMSPDQGKVMFE